MFRTLCVWLQLYWPWFMLYGLLFIVYVSINLWYTITQVIQSAPWLSWSFPLSILLKQWFFCLFGQNENIIDTYNISNPFTNTLHCVEWCWLCQLFVPFSPIEADYMFIERLSSWDVTETWAWVQLQQILFPEQHGNTSRLFFFKPKNSSKNAKTQKGLEICQY